MTDQPKLPILIRPTEIERCVGRILRAPDHDSGTADAGGSDGGSAGADAGADTGEDKTLMTGGAADGGDGSGDQGKDGEGKEAGADEGKKDGDGKAADEGDKKEAVAGPPEKYELTAPEGMVLDETVMAEADPVFRELGLSNEQAAKIVPLAGKLAERITAAQLDAHNALGADWAKEAKADPRIGGKNWPETERFVAKALDTAAQSMGKDGAEKVAAFKQLLDETKLGNHPVMVAMFRFYGERISEDSDFVRSDAGAAVKQDRLVALYPNDVPKTE